MEKTINYKSSPLVCGLVIGIGLESQCEVEEVKTIHEKFVFHSSIVSSTNSKVYVTEFSVQSFYVWSFNKLRSINPPEPILKNTQEFSSLFSTSYSKSFESLNLIALGELAHSGSKFYYSNDRKYLLKTISKSECKTLKKIFGSYFSFINQNNNSFLMRIHGLYKIKWKRSSFDRKSVFVLVTVNHLYNGLLSEPSSVFDLKCFGLKHKRDNKDFSLFLNSSRSLLSWGDDEESLKSFISENFLHDINFLSSIGVNDYSILLAIGDNSNCSLSIIDILSAWNIFRRIGWFFMPGIFFYFPRYTRPSTYGKRILKTLQMILERKPTEMNNNANNLKI